MPHSAPFHVDDDPATPGRSRLVLSGKVTVTHAGPLHHAAVELAQRGTDVTVDCSAVEYLDTSAVQLLISLAREQKRNGKGFEVVGASGDVREDFRLTGFAAGLGR